MAQDEWSAAFEAPLAVLAPLPMDNSLPEQTPLPPRITRAAAESKYSMRIAVIRTKFLTPGAGASNNVDPLTDKHPTASQAPRAGVLVQRLPSLSQSESQLSLPERNAGSLVRSSGKWVAASRKSDVKTHLVAALVAARSSLKQV